MADDPDKGPFDTPFTQRAATVLRLAMDRAATRGDPVIDTRHVIWGMAAEGGGVAAVALADLGIGEERILEWLDHEPPDDELPHVRVVDDRTALAAIGIDLDAVREIAATAFGEDTLTDDPVHPPLGDSAYALLVQSVNEARALDNNYVGTEHLLLGMTSLPSDSAGGSRLGSIGVSPDAVRGRVLQTVDRLQLVVGANDQYEALRQELVGLQHHVEQLDVELRRRARPVLARLTEATSAQWARLYPTPTNAPDPVALRHEFASGLADALAAARAELASAQVPLPTP